MSAGPTGKGKYESNITWEELERIISETNINKAPGEDTIPYAVIKELGPKAKKFILHMYDWIWNVEPIPQRWRTSPSSRKINTLSHQAHGAPFR